MSPPPSSASRSRALLLVLLALGTLALAALAWVGTRPAPRPNVLIVLWDTVRADRMSLYGYSLETTPRMAAWAKEHGVVFERAISPDMWTVPSHASLFTGLPPGTHGAGFDHRWLDGHRTTLAELFAEQGWDTFAFSANPNLSPSRVNLLQGFSTIETSWSRKWREAVKAHTRARLIAKDRSTEISPGSRARHAGTGFYNAGPIAHDALVGWLEKRRDSDRPFFAYLSYMEAHKPRVPPMPARKKVADEQTIELGLQTDITFKSQLLYSYGKKSYTEQELAAINRVYDATLVDLDNATADLLDDLQARGLLQDTIVIFTADHGEQLGEHQQFGHRSGVYQALLHVPLVIAYPRKLTAGRVAEPVSNLELFDTLLSLAGLPRPELGQVPGALFAERAPGQAVFAETLSIDRLGFSKIKKLYPELGRDVWANTYRAIVKGDWKLIQTIDFDDHEVVNCELYHLGSDPGEEHDRFEEQADLASRMAGELLAWKQAQVPWDAGQGDAVKENLSEKEKRQLAILGYLSEDDVPEEPAPETPPEEDAQEPVRGNRCRAGGLR